MKTNRNEFSKELGKYIRRTLKNKICALALIICGIVSVYVVEDPTYMLFTLTVGIPLFFTRKGVIE